MNGAVLSDTAHVRVQESYDRAKSFGFPSDVPRQPSDFTFENSESEERKMAEVEVLAAYARLSREKEAAEAQIAAIVEELTSGTNPAGVAGPLVDAEGFPRADIDVYRVRHQRHALVCLQNDHKAVMRQIEELLPR
jgi:hypothetical protein